MILNDPISGGEFQEAIRNRPPAREALAEDFLYKRTCTMVAADPGSGKSTVFTQAILEMSAGHPVFGYFHVPRPVNTYYIQLEGSFDETLERIGYMEPVCLPDYDNLVWDMPSMLNCMDMISVTQTLQRIQRWDKIPDLIVVDPIYMAIMGDLAKGEVSSALVHFAQRLKRAFDCAVILIHHTHRTKYSNEGTKVHEEDPYYGSQWLKAHVDVGYHLKKSDDGHQGVDLINKKSRGGEVQPHISLKFDPATFTCKPTNPRNPASAESLVIAHLERMTRQNQTTDFYGTAAETRLSPATLRRVQRDLTARGILVVHRNGDARAEWKLRPAEAVNTEAEPRPQSQD